MNMDLEEFMKQSKNKHAELDKELDAMMDLDDVLKHLNKKHKKNNSDAELDALENSDEEKNDDEDLEKQINEPDEAEEPDEWDEEIEKLYHKNEIFKALTVMQAEEKNLDEIIAFKMKKKIDFDFFETKKSLLQAQILKLENLCGTGAVDMEMYKKTLETELKYEEKLLKHCETNEKVKNKEFCKKRIQKRIDLINAELVEEVEPEPEPEEAKVDLEKITNEIKESEKVDEIKKDVDKKVDNDNDKKDEKTEEKTEGKSGGKTEEKSGENTEVKTEDKKVEVKEKIIEIDQELYDKIYKRADEYKEAKEYFIQNNFITQADDSKAKAMTLILALQKMKKGEKINELDLPYDITPEYICDCTRKERVNNFMVILKDYSARKKEASQKFELMKEKFKTLNKREFQKNKDNIQKILQDQTNKIAKFEGVIQKLTEMVKNEWTPCPMYIMSEEEDREEKINEDVEENQVIIHFKKTNYDKTNVYIGVTILYNEEKEPYVEYYYFKDHMNFDAKLVLKLDKSEFAKIYRKSIEVVFYRKHWYWPFKDQLKGNVKIDLNFLKSTSELTKQYDIDLISKRCVPKIEVSIKARVSCQDKEYTTTTKQVVSITKSYPPFKGSKVENLVEHKQVQDVKIVEKKPEPKKTTSNNKVTKVNKEPQKNNDEEKTDEKPNKTTTNVKLNKSDFSEEELKDPDCIDNLKSLEVLKVKVSHLEAEAAKIEGRLPKEIREKLMRTRVRKNALEKSIADGIITIDAYVETLTVQVGHDKNLMDYFIQVGDKPKSDLVRQRLTIEINELQEAKKLQAQK